MSELQDKRGENENGSPPQSGALFELLGKILENTDRQQSNAETTEKQENAIGSSNAEKQNSDMISSLLQSPELLSRLPQLISLMGPLLSGLSANKSSSSESITTVQKSVGDNISPPRKNDVYSDDRRAALLCAMKPYLSSERCAAIDHIIKLSRLGEILKSL